MPATGAFEVRHEGRVYRARDMETLMSWARERRIGLEDEIRPAGTTVWKSIGENEDLMTLLDPSHWWKLTIGEDTYKAPDFETVVGWAREGRLTSETIIEGPRTPPGGIRADALPRLAPHLREAGQIEQEEPPKVRFDGREYCPGDIATLRDWISESRIPVEAEVSLAGRPWEPVAESGLFEPELWPDGAWSEEEPPDVERAGSWTASGHGPGKAAEEERQPSVGGAPTLFDSESEGEEGHSRSGTGRSEGIAPAPVRLSEPLVIRTLTEEIVTDDPARLATLYRKRRVHSYDTVSHPSLPGGEATVAVAMDALGLKAGRPLRWWLWAIMALIGLGAAGILAFDPFQLF